MGRGYGVSLGGLGIGNWWRDEGYGLMIVLLGWDGLAFTVQRANSFFLFRL